MNDSIIDRIFEKYFSSIGDSVREEQRVVIDSVLSGNNTLSLMPTGGGKSLCYWIAGLALKKTTLVISPLTALMDEQALKLEGHGLSVLVLHSGAASSIKQFRQLRALYQGKMPNFIFTSPERMATDGFLEYVFRQRRDQIGLMVIDEIHCISQWGHDFRPFYKEIPPFLNAIFDEPGQWPPVLGLTATLNKKDTEEACRNFHIAPDHVFKSQYLLRYPIHIEVVKVSDEPTKDGLFWERLERHRDEKVLVYIDNKSSGPRSTEELAARASELGFKADFFHADMSSDAKAEIIRRFKDGELLTVFATSAFGMGIDIPDIRGVIHYRPPESIEQYYQQIGRVGRDGRSAWALIYYSDKNIDFRKRYFIDRSFPGEGEIHDAFQKLTSGTGEVQTFNYFGEPEAQSAFHYLLRSQAVDLECKGIQKIDVFTKNTEEPLPEFEEYQQSTMTGITVLAAKKCGVPVATLVNSLYQWYAEGKIETDRSPKKVLFIRQLLDELPERFTEAILDDAGEKREHRYYLLDGLAELLDDFTNSITLHQEIGNYLGVDKFQLRRMFQTVSGEMVRSKSEVIIANLLTRYDIPFQYEERLEAGGYGFWPDFTISVDGKTYYWEHLGRLDLEQYRQNWDIKRQWYDEHFSGQLLTTVETSALSRMAEDLIRAQLLPGLVEEAGSRTGDAPGVEIAAQPGTSDDVSTIQKIRLWTEGRTDWKHIKAAYRRLQSRRHFTSLPIQFQEDEDDMGDRELLRVCEAYSRASHPHPQIFVFDRDVEHIVRKVTDDTRNYKDWGNNVYSVALPVPEHRAETPEISIEFYYRDEEIKRRDQHGRRLFIGTEFNSRTTKHESNQYLSTDRNKVGKFTIIDSQVYRMSGDEEENVALSKHDFAKNVLNQAPNFDDFELSAFVGLFKLIEQLVSE